MMDFEQVTTAIFDHPEIALQGHDEVFLQCLDKPKLKRGKK